MGCFEEVILGRRVTCLGSTYFGLADGGCYPVGYPSTGGKSSGKASPFYPAAYSDIAISIDIENI